jgi:ferredoxin
MEESLSREIMQRQPRVDITLCIRCGLCIQNCPQGAISMTYEGPWIDSRKCKSCGQCIEICPRGAIRIPITASELMEEVRGITRRVDDILSRIEKVKNGVS